MKKKLNIYQYVWIFTIASMFGFLLETGWYFYKRGYIISRQGMIYGPFSQIYGFGAVLVCFCLSRMRRQSSTYVFLSCALLGSLFEYFTSFFQEICFGVISWDYSDQPLNIGGRVSLTMGLVWGVVGLVFLNYIYPLLVKMIESIPKQAAVRVAIALCAFFIFDLSISGMALYRQNQRRQGQEATSAIHEFLDERFPDERLNYIYSTAKSVEEDSLPAYNKNKVSLYE